MEINEEVIQQEEELLQEENVTPELTEEQTEEVDGQQEEKPVTFTQEQMNEAINKRLARERGKFEKAGLNPGEWDRIAKNYGVTPQYLIRHVLNELEKGSGQTTQQQQVPHDPRVDVLLQEKEESGVKKMWKGDFGADPTDDEIEALYDLKDQYSARGKNISLEDAYHISTRDTLKEKIARQAEAKYKADLLNKAKGKTIPGKTQTVTPTKSHASLGDALRDAAKNLDL